MSRERVLQKSSHGSSTSSRDTFLNVGFKPLSDSEESFFFVLVLNHQVSALLNGMLDHSFRERSLRKTQGKQLVEEVLKMWKSLQPWWEGPSATPDSKTATLLLLSKLLQVEWPLWYHSTISRTNTAFQNIPLPWFLLNCQIDSSVCSDVNHDAFRPVFTTFTVLLMDTNLPLNFKVTLTAGTPMSFLRFPIPTFSQYLVRRYCANI